MGSAELPDAGRPGRSVLKSGDFQPGELSGQHRKGVLASTQLTGPIYIKTSLGAGIHMPSKGVFNQKPATAAGTGRRGKMQRHPFSGKINTRAQMPVSSTFYGTATQGHSSAGHSRKLSQYKHTMTNINLFGNLAAVQSANISKPMTGYMPSRNPKMPQAVNVER